LGLKLWVLKCESNMSASRGGCRFLRESATGEQDSKQNCGDPHQARHFEGSSGK
jgi:hypothetical protein